MASQARRFDNVSALGPVIPSSQPLTVNQVDEESASLGRRERCAT